MNRFAKVFLSVGVFVSFFSVFPNAEAFRDLTPSSSIYPAVQSLIDRGVLEDGTFFRADSPVPAGMFWEMVLRDAGFDPVSATFDTPLPPNIKEDDPLAQFLREAGRRGFINLEEAFDEERVMSRMEAVETLVKTKGIMLPATVSNAFLHKASGVPPSMPEYLKAYEAAYASGVLEDIDVRPIKASGQLTRRDIVRWIYNFNTKGQKVSTLNPKGAQAFSQRRGRTEARPTTTTSFNAQERKKGGVTIMVQPVEGGGFSEVRQAGEGLRIPNGKILEDVFQKIQDEYFFSEKLTDEKKKEMVDAGISAMVRKMGDKYSSYIEPTKAGDFQDEMTGKYEGIGAYVEMNDKDQFVITSPITGSPAEKAGVMPGDIVTHIDSVSVDGQSVTEIVHRIKGVAGTKVTLTLLRGDKTLDISIVRGEIEIPSITIKWERNIPIIGLHKFTKETKNDLSEMLNKEVLTKKPRGIIFDLRNNPGGFLTSAVEVGEFFLNKDDLIFSVNYRDSKQEFKSSRKGELAGYKNLAFIQNNGSASASEILTGMIQDYKIGPIIGEKSVGKGTVQNVTPVSNGATLKLTIAKWLTPKGRWIQEGDDEKTHGVIPDTLVTNPTPEEKQQNVDRQLTEAVNYILSR